MIVLSLLLLLYKLQDKCELAGVLIIKSDKLSHALILVNITSHQGNDLMLNIFCSHDLSTGTTQTDHLSF